MISPKKEFGLVLCRGRLDYEVILNRDHDRFLPSSTPAPTGDRLGIRWILNRQDRIQRQGCAYDGTTGQSQELTSRGHVQDLFRIHRPPTILACQMRVSDDSCIG